MTTPKTLARATGLLYLIVAAGGLFALSVRTRIVEPGDAAVTADNIRASAELYRAAITSDVVAGTCFLLTVIALYALLKHVHQLVAGTMVTIAAVGVATGGLNALNEYTAITVATGGEYAGTFGAAGADTLTMLYINAHKNGGDIAYIFFALWLVPFGYLVIRSGYFPKVLGVALIVGCFGYLANSFTGFLALDVGGGIAMLFAAVGGLPELAFLTWLLVKGVPASANHGPVSDALTQPQPQH